MIEIYSLEGCYYSQTAEQLLTQYGIKHKVYPVSQKNKNIYKKKNKMNTFPQIFLKKRINNKMKTIKIGGCDDLKSLLEIYNHIKSSNIKLDTVCYFLKSIK